MAEWKKKKTIRKRAGSRRKFVSAGQGNLSSDKEDVGVMSTKGLEVLQELCRKTLVGSAFWDDCFNKGVQLCDGLDPSSIPSEDSTLLNELENLAIDFWNMSVAMKTRNQLPAILKVKMRHLAFTTLEFACHTADKDTSLKRQIMMGLKTGRACLDNSLPEWADTDLCKTERKKNLSDKQFGSQCIQRLQKLLLDSKSSKAEPTTGDSWDKHKLQTEQDLFAVKCSRAEANIVINKPDEALNHMMLAKELLPKFPKQGNFLTMLCYNAGVELYRQQKYQRAIVWLRESYELGKERQTIGPKNQARTLRLLANAYLQADSRENLQNALNAVSLANKEHCHPAGLFLMLKILLLKNAPDEALHRASEDLIKLPELTVEQSLHTLQAINQHKRTRLVTWVIEKLLKKFENSPDIGKLLVTNLEVLVEAGMMQQAREFVEYCITVHSTGQALDLTIRKRFHVILWGLAAKAFRSEDAAGALEWNNYSLSLYTRTDGEDGNQAKLHRNRANCYLAMQQLDKTQEALEESVRCDPHCASTQFMMFRLAVTENNSEKACSSVKKLCELSKVGCSGDNAGTSVCGFIALAAQQALEHGFTVAATDALERLCTSGSDLEQVLTALRCLIRLKLTSADRDSSNKFEVENIISHIRMGNSKLLQLQDGSGNHNIDVQKETSWFMKIAWNVSIQCEDQPVCMKDLNVLCSQLLSLLPQDDSSLSRQVTCLLMAAAACLQMARTETDNTTKKLVLEECLDHLAFCKLACSKILQESIGISESQMKETDVLVLLYEFEAKIRLQDPSAEAVLERALVVSGPDPKVFETLAAVAMEPPSNNKSLSVRALKVAIRKHLQRQNPDINRCSKLFHSLIELCLSGGSAEDLNGKVEVWNYYKEIFDVIDNRAQGQYPEMEVVWLMTKAWNCGINFFSCSKYQEAEKWCAMSMKMLKYLDAFKFNYQDLMSSSYTELLAKLESTKQNQALPF